MSRDSEQTQDVAGMPPAAAAERVVVLAPFGRDEDVLASLLEKHGFNVVTSGIDAGELREVLQQGTDVLVLTAEAFRAPILDMLGAHLYAEPVWSMPPVVLIAETLSGARSTSAALRKARPGLPVSILIRPCAEIEIVSAVGVAAETRRHQARIRDFVARYERAEKRAEFLFRELSHRVKNLFSIVSVIAAQTSQSAADGETFRDIFRGRLQALANTYAVLGRADWQGAELGEVVKSSVRSLLTPGEDARFVAHGPEVNLLANAASGLGLVMHELASNARKYGALSGNNGHVDVVWHVTQASKVVVEWREHGGPPVTPPLQRGFGTKVIINSMNGVPGAKVDLSFPPEGAFCRIAFDQETEAQA